MHQKSERLVKQIIMTKRVLVHLASSHENLLEQRKVFTSENVELPQYWPQFHCLWMAGRHEKTLSVWHSSHLLHQYFNLEAQVKSRLNLLLLEDITPLPPFSLIRDFGKQNSRGNFSKISVNLTCYRHIGSKSYFDPICQ